MSKISCIMPTRDRGNLIKESIESIINQTFSDWELIVIDDHSNKNDKTETIVKFFRDSRIQYYKLNDEQGKGISAGRNFGIALARGEFIALTDSDDINYPKRLELSFNEFQKNNPDVVYGDIDCYDSDTNQKIQRPEQYRVREFNRSEFAKADYIPNPTTMFKKSIVHNYPYNSFFCKAEDYDFFSRLCENQYKFSFIPESLVKYRIHGGSISSQDSKGVKYTTIVKENREWRAI